MIEFTHPGVLAISPHGFMEQGGPLMWLLLALSLLGFVFFCERTLYLHRGQTDADSFLSGIKNLVRKRRVIEALTVCEESPGPLPNIVKAALLQHGQPPERMRLAVQDAALVEIPLLERRIGTIAAIARISPLIGLLGTVAAMLTAFEKLHAAGSYADASLLAGLMLQGLLTTAVGLAIAAMATLAHHFLHGRLRALVHEMEWAANDIMQFLQSNVPDEGAAPPQ
jgi:biopolymer transport protein ExbB